MQLIITGGKLKPTIVIYCCCLFITLTNCDKKLLENSDYLVTSNRHQSLESNVKSSRSSQIPGTLAPVNSVTKKLNEQESITASKNSPNDVKHETPDITSKITNFTNSSKVNTGENVNLTTSTTREPGISSNIQPPNTEGALLRGASVFLGLSIVVIAYIIFRCARLNKNRTQMVRKYGILAHRQDVEMRPLPLDDEDEDDTTVFDASEVAGIHDKQRRIT